MLSKTKQTAVVAAAASLRTRHSKPIFVHLPLRHANRISQTRQPAGAADPRTCRMQLRNWWTIVYIFILINGMAIGKQFSSSSNIFPSLHQMR
jgi:hypothetical protein